MLASRERRRHAPRLVVDSRPAASAPARGPRGAHGGAAAPRPAATAAAAPVRVAAVGDVHPPSASANAAATAAEAAKADVILGLGDYQYPDGTMADFNAYFDRDWGPLVRKMYPVFGPTHDKDWQADEPLRYFNGAGAHGYRSPVALKPLTPYSFDRGAWHFVALPDACFRVSGCDPAPITAWLQHDLDAHPQAVHARLLAPAVLREHDDAAHRLRRGPALGRPALRPPRRRGADRPPARLRALRAAEPVASGRPERARRPSSSGRAASGCTRSRAAARRTAPVRQADTYGVLDLTLRDGAYDWRFVPVGGGRFADAGSAACR